MFGSRMNRKAASGAAQAPGAIDPYANQLDKVGGRMRILRIWQTAYLPSVGKHIEFMQFGKTDLRPLVWLHSVDYPMSPTWGFCVDAAEQGLSVISVRRPGFGGSSSATDTEEEVRILDAFLTEAGLENAILLVEGTSRPAGIRLARGNPRIAFTLLARPAYACQDDSSIEPWMHDLIVQTLQTRAGAKLSLMALSQLSLRVGHSWLYENFLKVAQDTSFVRSNARDLAEAWACLSRISADTFRRELAALLDDPSLVPGALADLNGMAVIGEDSLPLWRDTFLAKSESLGIDTALLPSGSLFALYQNPKALLQLIAERA